MFQATESDFPTHSNINLVGQALKNLKHSVSMHLEQETRLETLCLFWQQKWLSQCEQLRNRIDSLEAQLAPWMTEPIDGPRLAVISHHEEIG